MKTLYTALLFLLMPLVLLRLLWRSIKAPAYRERWRERFGYGEQLRPGGIWIHAVSVGEVQAVAPLVRWLLDSHPGLPLTITTTTPTGSAQVRRLFGEQVSHSYMPYDLPAFLNRFLDRVQPSRFLMVETEVWPNLLSACRTRGIHSLLANARLSARSLRRYRRVRGFAESVFGLIDQVAAQSDADGLRFQALGVDGDRIEVTGSIKFDISIPASVEEQVEVMRRGWGGRPVWVAASTHEGEEELMLVAHAQVKKTLPDALLVLVPRHPERFDRVTGQIIRSGLNFSRRSSGDVPTGDTNVYLGDTMGELPVMLGSADAAFIGGSLSKVGGHNMLEAAAQGLPVCFGPHTFNFALISQWMLDCGAARRVGDANELAEVISGWLSDASVRSEAGEAGRHLVEQNRGALARLQALVEADLN